MLASEGREAGRRGTAGDAKARRRQKCLISIPCFLSA